MSKLVYTDNGGIELDSPVPFPKFLYELLTDEQLAEVREWGSARFDLGYLWSKEEAKA
jgi:hypothetical protein